MRYPDVLAETLRRIGRQARRRGVRRRRRRRSARRWVVAGLRGLGRCAGPAEDRYRLIILSNVDRASFDRSAARLGVEFDLVVTAEDVGAYKPSTRSFPALIDRLAGDRRLPRTGCSTSRRASTTTTSRRRPSVSRRCGSTVVTTRWVRCDTRAGSARHADWRFTSMAAFADAAAVPDAAADEAGWPPAGSVLADSADGRNRTGGAGERRVSVRPRRATGPGPNGRGRRKVVNGPRRP